MAINVLDLSAYVGLTAVGAVTLNMAETMANITCSGLAKAES